jgi:hypothetical protein
MSLSLAEEIHGCPALRLGMTELAISFSIAI